jgi:hypothetical protein
LLYRIISFWFILVVGWLFIGQLALQVRRGRWSRSALASDVEAGPVVHLHPSQVGAAARAAEAEAAATAAEPASAARDAPE